MYVGIHARRGDFVTGTHEIATNANYSLIGSLYYNNAMDIFRFKYSSYKLVFLAASDDVGWLKVIFSLNHL